MIDAITPERIAASVMMNTTFSGAYLLVEGQRDFNLFYKFVDRSNCKIQISFGRGNLIAAIEILNHRSFTRVLGIIDRDFDNILAITTSLNNLLLSDYHDLEICLIESSALDHVLQNFSSEEKLKALIEKHAKNLRDILYELAYDVSVLKLANKIHNLGLVFKPAKPDGKYITYSDFVDFKTMERLSVDKMLKSIHDYSNNKGTTLAQLAEVKARFEDTEKMSPFDKLHLSNGHDLTYLLQLCLKKSIGSKLGGETSPQAIEASLILAYDTAEFKKTRLYSDIKTWEIKTKHIILQIF